MSLHNISKVSRMRLRPLLAMSDIHHRDYGPVTVEQKQRAHTLQPSFGHWGRWGPGWNRKQMCKWGRFISRRTDGHGHNGRHQGCGMQSVPHHAQVALLTGKRSGREILWILRRETFYSLFYHWRGFLYVCCFLHASAAVLFGSSPQPYLAAECQAEHTGEEASLPTSLLMGGALL